MEKTKVKILAILALAGLSATAASAADLAAPVAGSAYDWSGFYAGAHIGVANGHIKATDIQTPGGGFFTDIITPGGAGSDFSFSETNIAGGAHIGYQTQWDQFVFGGEASWTATGIDKTITSPYFPDSDTETGKLKHYATVVARVGYAFDRFMVYAKGGYAGGEVSFRAYDCCSQAQGVSYEQSGWQNGYAVGAGIDYALTDKLILGVDYTHIDLGSKSGTGPNVFDDGSLGSNPETFKIKARADVVMARLSYKFGN
ncbi:MULTISPECIES: outer membrane protein [unclassified Mesorhizobium]|uniref:outer membrane protein n=1 Tax=unclassified Mesorhizobium TaxID=325217 RepID=UPI001CCF9973|nr:MULTISPECIES: outer membrane beta-barrel protein [unclassified Mesorhizobium]MBZ9740534.1 outer membrane beta-barrel protein [Mesorhizobium sp. CO1-1-4]MBZ9800527.1 outer membrane beta-barrel protein [Mesorhizobium sp. ES1-6]